MRPGKSLRRALRVTAQVLLISLITFVLTEISFRVYAHAVPSFIFHGSAYSRSYNTYRGKPNSGDYDSKLNSHGFKGKDYTLAKPAQTYRILAVGDSFTVGVVPYQYNYINLIERQLNSRLASAEGRAFEVINMGISGTGPRDYLTLLVDEGLALAPDMLVVSFFLGNDLIEAQRNDTSQDSLRKQPWYASSYVLCFAHYALAVTRNYEGVVRAATKYVDDEPTYSEDSFLEIQERRLQNFVKEDPELLEAFRRQTGYLAQIKRICDQRHIKLLIVIIPDEMQVNRAQQAQLLELTGLKPDQVDMRQPNRLACQAFAAKELAYLDLLPVFSASKENLYKPRNTHWNIAGNRLAAEQIVPKLIEMVGQKQGALSP
jgi:hypothetical protein